MATKKSSTNSGTKFCTAKDFKELMAAIDSFPGESTKKQAILSTINSNNLSASQLAQLVNLLAIEKDKFDILVAAYPKSKDKKNYLKTVSILSSISDKEKILEMIG
jgi:hypothetical protein